MFNKGLGSSVGTATAYGLDGPGIESRWGARFSAPVQTGPEAHPASCKTGRVQLKPDLHTVTHGTGSEELVNGVGSQYSHTASELGVSSITTADAHASAASSRLN